MLKQYARRHDYPDPHHEPGEVVLATFGNFLESAGDCTPKPRPVILLRTSDCQHAFAGLTTKPQYLTSGEPRPLLPQSDALGLDGKPSFLWSSRAAFITRIDVRRHLGWIDHPVVEFLAEHMLLDTSTFSMLWRAASMHALTTPRHPR